MISESHEGAEKARRSDDRDRAAEPTALLLRNAHVTILGVGGVGGVLAARLAARGVRSLHLIDGGRVTASDMGDRDIFEASDLGKMKTHVMLDRLRPLNSWCDISVLTGDIDCVFQISDVLRATDLFVTTAPMDDLMPYWIAAESSYTGTPWIDCTVDGPLITCVTYEPGPHSCRSCLTDSIRERVESPRSRAAPSWPATQLAGTLASYEVSQALGRASVHRGEPSLRHLTLDYAAAGGLHA